MATVTDNARRVSVTKRDGSVKSVMTDLDIHGAVRILAGMERSDFARSLADDHYRYRHRGGLTGNRAAWALVVAQEEIDRRARVAEAAQAGQAGERVAEDFGSLVAIFGRARRGGRLPRITLKTDGGRPVMLAVAGDRSKAPGSVNVTDGRRYPDNTWYGRIETTGDWRPGRAADDEVTDLVRRFAADPAGVAAAYGRMTGACCFCQRELTDERSTTVGYGPVCADRFGLPWGERPAPALVEDEADAHGVGPRS